MKKIMYIVWFLCLITLSGCTIPQKNSIKYNISDRNMSFYYPKTYTVKLDPNNHPALSIWINKGTWDDESLFLFQKWICFPEMVRTGWETIINGNKFFVKQVWEKTAYEKSAPEWWVSWESGKTYYYYEDYPELDTCTSFTSNAKDPQEQNNFEQIIHSITFNK